MFLPAKLDERRLQSVIEKIERGGFLERGEGKTLALIYLMVAEVELGDPTNRYLYIGENEIVTRYVAHDFLTLIEEILPGYFEKRGGAERAPSMIVVEKQVFHFISGEEFIDGCRSPKGKFNRIFVDITSVKQDQLDRNGALMVAFIDHQGRGADFI